jgi:hypothetical protein
MVKDILLFLTMVNRAGLVIGQDRTCNGPRDPLTVIGIGGSFGFDLIGQESTFDEDGG